MEDNQDSNQLRLLSIFHFVVAGIAGIFSLFPIIHLLVGIGILTGAFDEGTNGVQPPPVIGWLFISIALVFITVGLTLATCIAVAGGKLGRRAGYSYCIAVAGIECIFMPFGTVLGVLTIMVLLRPSVKLLFGITAAPTMPKIG